MSPLQQSCQINHHCSHASGSLSNAPPPTLLSSFPASSPFSLSSALLRPCFPQKVLTHKHLAIGNWGHSIVSASLRSYGLWPARILHPWGFPGKNTEVGCSFLLQGIPGVKLESLALQADSTIRATRESLNIWLTACFLQKYLPLFLWDSYDIRYTFA